VIASSKLSRYFIALALFLIFPTASGGNEATPQDIQVELNSQIPLSLHMTLWCRAETRVTFAKWRLPWGNRNSMILVAVTPGKEYIVRNFPVDDPSYEKVSLEPNESLSGDVSLQKAFTGLDVALKKSEIHLFWAYEAPKELHIAHWSGGWILIPKGR